MLRFVNVQLFFTFAPFDLSTSFQMSRLNPHSLPLAEKPTADVLYSLVISERDRNLDSAALSSAGWRP